MNTEAFCLEMIDLFYMSTSVIASYVRQLFREQDNTQFLSDFIQKNK